MFLYLRYRNNHTESGDDKDKARRHTSTGHTLRWQSVLLTLAMSNAPNLQTLISSHLYCVTSHLRVTGRGQKSFKVRMYQWKRLSDFSDYPGSVSNGKYCLSATIQISFRPPVLGDLLSSLTTSLDSHPRQYTTA